MNELLNHDFFKISFRTIQREVPQGKFFFFFLRYYNCLLLANYFSSFGTNVFETGLSEGAKAFQEFDAMTERRPTWKKSPFQASSD